MPRLKVAFLWHMHQPWYVWPGTQEAALPFARLHAYAGYYDMPWVLQEQEATKVTFNLVPSLTEQLRRYASGELTDRALELSRRPATELEPDDERYLLATFSGAHPDAMPELSPRYAQLCRMRGHDRGPEALDRARAAMQEQDWRDLQVWLNLACCGYALTRESEVVRELKAKDRGFAENEKAALLEELQAAVGRVLDLYREAQASGRAELSASPFYHPILPLLCDMRDAMRRIPREALPETLWHEPEEARRQLLRAREHHARLFGREPAGLWPSEGSVSDAALAVIEETGFAWAASDEEVLAQSLGRDSRPSPQELYQPYRVGDDPLSIVFRDHGLSDCIGFVYRDWAPRDAAGDFIGRLLGISSAVRDLNRPGLVCVMLDGENAWGTYPDGGEGFLKALYAGIEEQPELETTTLGEYLEEFPPEQSLSSVFPGSWIDHSYSTWIGGAEHKRAWDLVRGALEAVERSDSRSHTEAAREHLMAAEGSDWYWWYSESHHDEQEAVFDQLLRANVGAVYGALGRPEPRELAEAITVVGVGVLARQPSGHMTPVVDGRVTSYFEWQAAGLLRTSSLASAMHRSDCVIREVRFGFDEERLWLRVDTTGRAASVLGDCELELTFAGEPTRRLAVKGDAGELLGDLAGDAVAEVEVVVEVGVLLGALGVNGGESVELAVAVVEGERVLERWPQRGFVSVEVPSTDEVSAMWIV